MKPRKNTLHWIYLGQTTHYDNLCSASVDLATDTRIQRTVQTQFKECTLLCIARTVFPPTLIASVAHQFLVDRLRTIISYDRILVMDQGMVAVSAPSSILSTMSALS